MKQDSEKTEKSIDGSLPNRPGVIDIEEWKKQRGEQLDEFRRIKEERTKQAKICQDRRFHECDLAGPVLLTHPPIRTCRTCGAYIREKIAPSTIVRIPI